MTVVRAALAQIGWSGDRASMRQRLASAVDDAARRGAHLVAFPELCTTPYFCTHQEPTRRDLAEPIPNGPAVRLLSRLARDVGVVVVVPLAERDNGRTYNSVAVIDADGRLVGRYRKQHLPHLPEAWERSYFDPGDGGWPVFATAAGRLGVTVCWDRWFPESWRALALDGAEIIVNPIATTIDRDHRLATLVQSAAAFTNQVFVATVNRVGCDEPGGPDFSGGSYFAGPSGEIFGTPAPARPILVLQDLDLDQIAAARREWPLLAGRRPETYRSIVREQKGVTTNPTCSRVTDRRAAARPNPRPD